MGKYNDAMCGYLSQPDVFADYWNGVFFEGEVVLKGEELEDADGNYYRIERPDKTARRSRDVIKKRKDHGSYIILGIEDQSEISYLMPLRQMEYDAMEYSRQAKEIVKKNRDEEKRREAAGLPTLWKTRGEFLEVFRKEDSLVPVITTVFYHRSEKYDGCKDLHGMLKLDRKAERFRRLVPNYPLNLVTLQDISEEKFQTGLRELIGVMKRSKDKNALYTYCQEHEDRFRELDEETIRTMSVMINQENLLEYRQKEGGFDMCKAFEDMKQEGIEIGLSRGVLETCRELGTSREEAIRRVMQKCGMERSEAEKLAEMYWK